MDVGIVGYGSYIPYYRIKTEEIARVWGANPESIKKGLMVSEKSVPGPDEDAVTIATEASRNALALADIDPEKIGAVYVGSESHPYSVKPSSTIVAEAIEATPIMTAADLEFACKAGTAGMQICMGLVGSGMAEYGLAVGADTSQGAPGDPLEYTAAAGGAAFIIGKDNLLAKIESTSSFTTDTPDFWRRPGEAYPKHGGRFTGEPAYFKHIVSCTEQILKDSGYEVKDFKYFVPHQPNGKFPRIAAKKLGFTEEQVSPSLLVERIGNTYSGASVLGLAAVLDQAEEGDKILLTSYGSGAGSDSFILETTGRLEKVRGNAPSVESQIEHKHYIDYATYAKYRGKIKKE
ncbi:TPA: hydroxymethylglutaryl-CoA synthase [archaeon]|jgi:hydroxymethylglutaryl-CoA synthase|uniref:Hydroxymethylglutaryl-CoA synthase n=1 Tax=Candidatus Undinarchaeum marinum TaxID=2756141 RepID=A0A832V2N8_9ARCH|nr:hydroxymethylglutaryl-CoA synthase [Candidatus Undinarchaeum marinum]